MIFKSSGVDVFQCRYKQTIQQTKDKTLNPTAQIKKKKKKLI